MSKVAFVLLILLSQFILLPSATWALVTCSTNSDTRIALDKNLIPRTTEPKVLEFTISNIGMAQYLQGKQMVFQESHWLGLQDINSEFSAAISGNKFSVELTNNALKEIRKHEGELRVVGADEALCAGISYEIGAEKQCYIDQTYLDRNPIQPNGQITIKFKGFANRPYKLVKGLGSKPSALVAKTSTDAMGDGSFDNVTINGEHGETVRLLLDVVDGKNPFQNCNPTVRLSNSAGPPEPPSKSTVAAPEPAKPCTGTGCTTGAVIPCGSETNPGISTAIGCIHTNPAEFAKDFMTFAIGIGGGLAFLMMLLGAFQMLTSAGNPDTLKAGQDRLTSAVIGLLFVIFAVLLLQIIGVGILKIPGFTP